MNTKPKKDAEKKAVIIRKEWPRVRDLTPTGKKLFVVDARPHGRREGFAEKNDALVRAEQLAVEIENKGTEALSLPTALRIMAGECAAKLAPFGKDLRDATNHYVSWLRSEKQKSESQIISACVAKYMEARTLDEKRKDIAKTTLDDIKWGMKPLVEGLGGVPVMSVTRDSVQTLLDSLPVSARSRLNFRLRWSCFFNWCKGKAWIEKNPCEEIRISVKSGTVRILTVAQSEALVKAAASSPHADVVVPYAAICLFAGLRPGEAEQLRWEHIHFDTTTIEVLGHTSKTGETRFVPMEKNLVEWLADHKQKSGRIIGPNFRKIWEATKAAAGKEMEDDFMWNNADVLRHSYGSYWLAVHKNRAELAEHMGNTVEVIKKHYRRPVLEATGRAFFELSPKEKKAKTKKAAKPAKQG